MTFAQTSWYKLISDQITYYSLGVLTELWPAHFGCCPKTNKNGKKRQQKTKRFLIQKAIMFRFSKKDWLARLIVK